MLYTDVYERKKHFFPLFLHVFIVVKKFIDEFFFVFRHEIAAPINTFSLCFFRRRHKQKAHFFSLFLLYEERPHHTFSSTKILTRIQLLFYMCMHLESIICVDTILGRAGHCWVYIYAYKCIDLELYNDHTLMTKQKENDIEDEHCYNWRALGYYELNQWTIIVDQFLSSIYDDVILTK